MKRGIILFIICFLFKISFAQSGEFEIQENGLIYSEATMNPLKEIVDSLNLKFMVCDINKTFYSKYQAIGHQIRIKGKNAKDAKKDMENNIGFDKFVEKYPKAEISKNLLFVKFNYKNYQGKDIVEFSEINLDKRYGYEIRFEDNLEKYNSKNLSNWIFDYSGKSIIAFYFPNQLESKEIPQKYAQMISYADCLIDTTVTKLKKELESGWIEFPKNWKKKSRKKQEELLEKLRSTRVIGTCSQDSRPREHAVNIAMVSAETQNWQIFLRAHLDVMNDRFERVSDGSYALNGRKTYIRELEELNINVLDLILGISLRVENPSKNHYYGSISRIGRALAETKNRKEVEHLLFEILQNKELDLYNRILGLYMLNNYIYNLEDGVEKQNLRHHLKLAIESFPNELSEKIKIE